MSDITLAEMQRQVDEWITTTGVRYFSELTNMAILTEEVGEGSPADGPSVRRTVLQTF